MKNSLLHHLLHPPQLIFGPSRKTLTTGKTGRDRPGSIRAVDTEEYRHYLYTKSLAGNHQTSFNFS